ncbi:unnamed protein product [Angiostrongylus costaricensis]|uniref:DMAP-interaction domain-containing protein n=1 Tax=Angiostrongylus costaricensis TaxID=334426 RepID=A0A0R3PYM3_ANGCS|nr:unnamed protein product [Angiostrongylus costaricensis]
MLEQDLTHLPEDVREQLAILELELSEGDITQKGYEKKRSLIFAKYCKGYSAGPGQSKCSPGTRARRQHQRRLTRDESRFHSEIRAEAVQQALAEYSHGNKVLPGVVQPVKRASEARCHLSRASGPSSNGAVSFSTPPDVTGGAAVEAMLRRVQEQHESKPQIHRETEASPKMTSSSPDVDAGRVPVKSGGGVDQSSIGGDVEQVTCLKDEAVYVNRDRLRSPNGRTTPPNLNYQNAVFRKFAEIMYMFLVQKKLPKLSHKLQQVVNCLQTAIVSHFAHINDHAPVVLNHSVLLSQTEKNMMDGENEIEYYRLV